MAKERAFAAPPEDLHRVSMDGGFRLDQVETAPPADAPDRRGARRKLEKLVDRLDEHQRVLYAQDRHSILCIFQAMDAAGKDSTIRAVTRGMNPAGFQVYSFKTPSNEEMDHDYLWRAARRLPERGRIGVFNRSHYEEVLIVRVHPGLLKSQRLPEPWDRQNVWKHRFESIRDFERHLTHNGTVVLKFWLHVSRDEQRRRFLERIRNSKKNWKFSAADVEERGYWDAYMRAYEECVRETSTPWAPWYAIPADDKPYMRLAVARILERTLDSLDLNYPKLSRDQIEQLGEMKRRLEQEKEG